MNNNLNAEQLKERARLLRISILEMLYEAGSGHPGGSLSAIDIMTVLYNNIMSHNPKDPKWTERDRFILSKGHIAPALYAVLADCGYYDVKELKTLRKYGSILQGHPYMHKTPGVEVSAGSLGQGLSVAAGIAMGARLSGKGYRVYCMMGDGEIQEGQIWEAAMSAGHYKLDNLCAILDYNHVQIDGTVEEVMDIYPCKEKWLAFNWNVIEVDGHDVDEIENAFINAQEYKGKPSIIIANTIKGKGVSFMENKAAWHGTAPNKDQLEAALAELQA
ncbi:transketolase [Clostridium thailandense]|uniref:transketolase n=1 Tax=Clostridium thailandense TaxID=2794346 RepID=UPI003988F5DD